MFEYILCDTWLLYADNKSCDSLKGLGHTEHKQTAFMGKLLSDTKAGLSAE